MSEYNILPGGSLKLKGGVVEGGVVKKKKKSRKSNRDAAEQAAERERVKQLLFKEEESEQSPSGSGRNSPAANGAGSSSKKTDAEKRFEEVRKQRLEQRVAKLATKTHKDRVNEFNTHLELLSEHHDIPKVGPG